RVVNKVALHEAREIAKVSANGHLDLTLSGGEQLHADHVFLATGYQMDLDRLSMIDGTLRTDIATYRGSPLLNSRFESSVPGLYFVGCAAKRSLAPLYRFVSGV